MSKKNKQVLVVIAIVAVAALLIFKLVEVVVVGKLEKYLEEGPLKGHVISYDGAGLKLFPPGLDLEKIRVVPDSASPLFKDPDSAAMMDWFRTEKFNLELSGVGIIQYLRKDILNIQSVIIEDPWFYVYLAEVRDDGRIEENTDRDNKGRGLKKLEIGKLSVSNGKLKYIRRGENGAQMNIEGVKAVILGIDFSSGSKIALGLDKADISFTGSDMVLPGGFYNLATGPFNLSTPEGSFMVDSVMLKPLFDKKEFARRAEYQTDRYDLEMGRITGEDIHFDTLISDSVLRMGVLAVDDLTAFIHRDKNIPRDPDFHPPLPHLALAKLGFPVFIDSVVLREGNVTYQELESGHVTAGEITINSIGLTVREVTNFKERMGEGSKMIAEAKGLLTGTAELHLSVEFPLQEEPTGFSFTGTLEPFELSRLNTIIAPNMGLRIESGRTSYLAFNAVAGLKTSGGRLRMHYNDANITVLRRITGNHSDQSIFTRLETAAANQLIHKKNPKKGKERIGKMYFERDMQKSFLNYMIKTLLSGVSAILAPGKNHVMIEPAGEPGTKAKD